MKLAKIIGNVTATAKDAQLSGHKLLICDIIDGAGAVTEPAVVSADTVGAGVGETVLITTGSAARLPSGTSGIPVDAVVVAIVDNIKLS